MASLRRYDVQAKFSLLISLAALIPLALAVYVGWTKYNPDLRAIQYGSTGMFRIGFLLCIAASGALSVAGSGLGFNSASQRRNSASFSSWVGFFLGMATLSLSIIAFFAFRFLGLEINIG